MPGESHSKSWVNTLPGVATKSTRLATDSQGNLYACGVFHGSLQLGKFQLKAGQHHAMYIARMNAAGGYLSAHKVGKAPSGMTLSSCRLDQDDNIILTGHYNQEMALGNIQLPTQKQKDLTNAFLASVTPEGKVMWAQAVAAQAGAQGTSLAISPEGDIWWTGYFRGTGQFSDIQLKTQSADSPQMFLARLDRDGEFLRVLTMQGHSVGTDVKVDNAGNITIAGIFQNMLIIGSDTHISQGKSDIFVAQLNKESRVVWSTSLGSKNDDNGVGIATGQDGSIYIHSTLAGNARIGDTLHNVESGKRHVLTKVDIQGQVVWSQGIETVPSTTQKPYERLNVAISAQNIIYVLTGRNAANNKQSSCALSMIPDVDGASRQNITSGQGVVGQDFVVDQQGHAIVTGHMQGSTTLQQHQFNNTNSTFIWRTGK